MVSLVNKYRKKRNEETLLNVLRKVSTISLVGTCGKGIFVNILRQPHCIGPNPSRVQALPQDNLYLFLLLSNVTHSTEIHMTAARPQDQLSPRGSAYRMRL